MATFYFSTFFCVCFDLLASFSLQHCSSLYPSSLEVFTVAISLSTLSRVSVVFWFLLSNLVSSGGLCLSLYSSTEFYFRSEFKRRKWKIEREHVMLDVKSYCQDFGCEYEGYRVLPRIIWDKSWVFLTSFSAFNIGRSEQGKLYIIISWAVSSALIG